MRDDEEKKPEGGESKQVDAEKLNHEILRDAVMQKDPGIKTAQAMTSIAVSLFRLAASAERQEERDAGKGKIKVVGRGFH